VVYWENQPLIHAYFVVKGEFVLEKSLPNAQSDQIISLLESSNLTIKENLLAKKFTELSDFPLTHKLGTYCRGSILAEEDVVNEREYYSCTVKCISESGSLY